ncbi:hypothetical protein BKA67DRAFT_61597 [Truncatella angustata]|uniref:Uncharacterized protein n=1 Tax=Truncatella angustata TaxID=152316 RepID=A0A9P9A5A2_9PEZI|nr:uncharacterized protein BKA67DRAFT_61597 [Truncatella angustata]KAH6660664.1 hypothetical protein BKA67DRAFT_61597 [Truncatella angustata]
MPYPAAFVLVLSVGSMGNTSQFCRNLLYAPSRRAALNSSPALANLAVYPDWSIAYHRNLESTTGHEVRPVLSSPVGRVQVSILLRSVIACELAPDCDGQVTKVI